MSVGSLVEPTQESVESLLREELAQGDAVLSTAAPVMRYLLAHDDSALFSDEIVARTRGLMLDVAHQLLRARAEALGHNYMSLGSERQDDLAMALADEPALLAHVHALTIEGTIALQLQARSGIDAVLSPLLRELVGSREDAVAGIAVAALAAQARFILHHRRMLLPLGELPEALFETALDVLRASCDTPNGAVATAGHNLRAQFDRDHTRLALIAQLARRMEGTRRSLDVADAGVAIFATALATVSTQSRDQCLLSIGDERFVRVALALRAAGLTHPELEAQLLQLGAEAALPRGLDAVSEDVAASLLGAASHGG